MMVGGVVVLRSSRQEMVIDSVEGFGHVKGHEYSSGCGLLLVEAGCNGVSYFLEGSGSGVMFFEAMLV